MSVVTQYELLFSSQDCILAEPTAFASKASVQKSGGQQEMQILSSLLEAGETPKAGGGKLPEFSTVQFQRLKVLYSTPVLFKMGQVSHR